MTAGPPVRVVDAFADKPFTGNPAGVVFLDGPRDDAWCQGVAAEFNLSETAFVESEGGAFRLRWFTPTAAPNLASRSATTRKGLILTSASRRGGFLLARPKDARVEVGGRAVTAWSGSRA